MLDTDRLRSVYHTVRADLLRQVRPSGHWEGELASSPLATATALSALVVAEQHGRKNKEDEYLVYQADLSELIVNGLLWLAQHQNEDGGWGDTDRCQSNISATMLVQAAFRLTGEPVKYRGLLERATAYIEKQGGVPALRRRYGKDKTFAVPILANCALAGIVPWRDVPALPFELACFPQSVYRRLRLPVVGYAIPALVAIGLARFHHAPPLNPITRLLRRALAPRSLDLLAPMQPASGGFLEAVPLTSFVVMSMASFGRTDHAVVRRGVEFLLASARADGSWPVDTNLATWLTSLAARSLVDCEVDGASNDTATDWDDQHRLACLDWLLACQHTRPHPITGAEPGGWAWTDRSGGVPDVDDTSAALLALRSLRETASGGEAWRSRDKAIIEAARKGIDWLLGVQNADGGWPTFCQGWGRLPFDRSGSDLTAHALRALNAWREPLEATEGAAFVGVRIYRAIDLGWAYLHLQQSEDGSWAPLWFGNQHNAGDENRVYGTSRVLLALQDLGKQSTLPAQRGFQWLVDVQHASGGWGALSSQHNQDPATLPCSVEETAVAIEALLGAADQPSIRASVDEGLAWLVRAVEDGAHQEPTPIGFYFAKLWYYDRLYPALFATAALRSAVAKTVADSTSDVLTSDVSTSGAEPRHAGATSQSRSADSSTQG